MDKFILTFISILVFAGCKVLSKQESTSVKSVAKAINLSAGLPSDFAKQYYNLLLESNQLSASFEKDPAIKISLLKKLIKERTIAEEIVSEYLTGYSLLKKYAELLLALTDSSYFKELDKQKNAFIPVFDTLVLRYNTFNPDHKMPMNSLGALVSNLIQEIGTRRIGYLQRKFLRKLVTEADPIITRICDKYKAIDFYKNNVQLASLGNTLDDNFKAFIKDINMDKNHADTYSYYNLYDPIYLSWKNKEATLSEFNENSIKTISNITSTHFKLKEMLNKKSSAKDITQNLQSLYASLNALQESYKKFHKDLSPVK